jgi:hypothetical protein
MYRKRINKEDLMKMQKMMFSFVGFLILVLSCGQVSAYAHANRYGGSTSHSYGHTSHSNPYGGSTSHTYGEGTEHTNAYGGSTAHGWYGGTEHTNVYGGTTAGAYGAGAVHTTPYGATTAYHGAYYPAYHPPTTVNYYGSSCYNCGGWSTAGAVAAGAVVGMAAGAAIASSSASANTAAATSSAYSAGYAAGAANAYAIGAIYATLPAGCQANIVNGMTYDLCGGAWFQPSYGANGVYYKVVPTP